MDTNDLIDAVADLQHDLGKALFVSMSWLPAEASASEVREAAHTALHRTRRGPDGVRTAAALYADFLAEAAEAVTRCRRWTETREAIERALAHGPAVADPERTVDRATLQADFNRAYARLCDLLAELNFDDF